MNCLPREIVAAIHIRTTKTNTAATYGVLAAIVTKKKRSPRWTTDPPDFPIRDPTPSIAAFPFSFDSLLSGIKDISFVASKIVCLQALVMQQWKDPIRTLSINGVAPRIDESQVRFELWKITKTKKVTPVARVITGVTMALAVHERLLIKLPEIKTDITIATKPIQVMTSPIYPLYSLALG